MHSKQKCINKRGKKKKHKTLRVNQLNSSYVRFSRNNKKNDF